ncbi:cation:proton antiporter [Inquilinus limosus]|uniref:cation:proton antiporter n=1 Tax=Inquilinus limosus TaxID=171674 RepID=UPI00068C77D3|nr:sodium:proton antiporter [Inquilinus limosus]
MPDIALAVLAISILIVLVALLQPLATRLSLPHSVLIAGLGIALGSVASATGVIGGGGPLSEFAHAVTGGEIRSEAILHIFLPILLFEAGLHMDVRRMMDDVAPILTLAVVAVLVCSLVVGVALWGTSSQGLVLCLLLGAIVATTDPAAVIGIFRDAGAPRRLTILVEGESLLNDAAAITLYIVLIGLLTAGGGTGHGAEEADASGAPLLFLRFFIGGGLFGFIAGRLAFMVMRPLNRYPVAEVAFTLALPYIAYVVAERYLHVSGVVAVVTVALVVGSTGRVRISAEGWEGLEKVWALLGFCASTLIFIFAAMLVPEFLRDATVEDGLLLLVLISAAFAARAIVLWGLLPVLTWLKVGQPVSTPYRVVILWGGLRGAVTLALALAVSENPLLGTEATHFVVVLATGFVLWTLLVNATTLRLVMRALGMGALSPTELALRDRALHQAREGIAERIEEIAEEQHLAPEVAKEAAEAYRSRLSGLASRPFMLDPKEPRADGADGPGQPRARPGGGAFRPKADVAPHHGRPAGPGRPAARRGDDRRPRRLPGRGVAQHRFRLQLSPGHPAAALHRLGGAAVQPHRRPPRDAQGLADDDRDAETPCRGGDAAPPGRRGVAVARRRPDHPAGRHRRRDRGLAPAISRL